MSKPFVERPQTTVADALDMIDTLKEAMIVRLERHGYGLGSGPHEILGILQEEMDELIDEVRANAHLEIYNELVDIAIAAVFGMLTMQKYIWHKKEQQS